jgi:hypothetical protein
VAAARRGHPHRPATIAGRDDRGRLHSAAGPALGWADGYVLHAIHGVRVPAQVVEAPETITIGQIHRERNVEVRRFLRERYGLERYLRDTGAERVHADNVGVLWHCPVPEDDEALAAHGKKKRRPRFTGAGAGVACRSSGRSAAAAVGPGRPTRNRRPTVITASGRP